MNTTKKKRNLSLLFKEQAGPENKPLNGRDVIYAFWKPEESQALPW